ncbi:hypothetical protein [Candidatus Pelagibacter sp.]|uniref:hypothetical protein n=1 Tax=Candidatus Pelagibacter sp. TaxID=2024849 RepID=UPI003F841383
MYYIKRLYIFFSTLALIIFFFSTEAVKAKSFEINGIEITQPFEINFDKNKVIDLGFEKAFFELVYSLIKSQDFKKIDNLRLNEIKGMIETFSIKEEKFIDQKYYVNLGVSFNKKKIFRYLEKKNIFPSQIVKEQFLFIPIIIDENGNDLSIFSDNPIYANWNKINKRYQLINYLLPSEDLEDLNLIKKKLDVIETYNFSEITKKYFLKNSIISLIFRGNNELRILTKIYNHENEIIKNNTFKNINIDNEKDLNFLIQNLKNLYEDTWKKLNEINTSIKVPITIKIKSEDLKKSNNFELFLNEIDMVSDYSIQKFDKEFIFYEVLFNGTVQNFINIMKNKKYNLNTQKKVWIIE